MSAFWISLLSITEWLIDCLCVRATHGFRYVWIFLLYLPVDFHAFPL